MTLNLKTTKCQWDDRPVISDSDLRRRWIIFGSLSIVSLAIFTAIVLHRLSTGKPGDLAIIGVAFFVVSIPSWPFWWKYIHIRWPS